METVYDAENTIEAHMIVHLLARSEIEAGIDGERLQGGVGELPAHGNIRVVVAPDDVVVARTLIVEWEELQRAETSAPTQETRKGSYSGFIAFLAGAGIATAFLLWSYNSPVGPRTSDYNRDGKPDEWTYWRGETVSKVDVDRNLDGLVDARFEYSARNSIEKSEYDNDFDGTFEYVSEYRYAQPYFDEVDVNGNGQPDRRVYYVHGVLTRIDMFRTSTRIVRKSQTFEKGGILVEARWDSDDDGVLDTLIKYGPLEEEISRSPIPHDR